MNTIPRAARYSCFVALAAMLTGCGGSTQTRPPSRGIEGVRADGAANDATRFYRTMGLASAHAPVSFVGKVSYFASPTPDTTIVLVSMSLPSRTLTFTREEDLYAAPYAVQLRLTRGGEELQRVDAPETVRVGSFRETTRTDESVIFQRYLRIPPGQYTLGFYVRDIAGGRTSSDTLVISVPRLEAGSLSSALPAYDATPRQRLDSLPRAVPSPRSTAVFGRDSVVSVYVEAYGAETAVPVQVAVRDEAGTMLWSDTASLARRGALLSGEVDVPVARLGVGVANVAFTRLDTRDSSVTPVFVSFGDDLPVAPFEEMLEYLRFFASQSRLAVLRNAPPERRPQLWVEFLRATDPDPTTATHEGLREYFRRVQLANERFRDEAISGRLSDRAMVYVVLGEPDNVIEQMATLRDRNMGSAQRMPVQIWEYRGHRIRLIFADERRTGRWELTRQSENEFRSLSARLLAR